MTLVAISLSACSHVREKSEVEEPSQFVKQLCTTSTGAQEVSGSVWMKAKSKEASGQFPARVLARSGNELRLEITQLLGARAALIEIRGNDFRVETPQDGAVSRKATSWGGIPLEWASRVFMDRLPCPAPSEIAALRWRWVNDREIEGRPQTGDQKWVFRLGSWNQKPWVKAVLWQKSSGNALELKREDPDTQEGWATRWEVVSSVGEVKVRWKERKTR